VTLTGLFVFPGLIEFAVVFAVEFTATFVLLFAAALVLLTVFAFVLAGGLGGGGSGWPLQNQAPKMIKIMTIISGTNHFIVEVSLSSE
jgi:hypothetical protein